MYKLRELQKDDIIILNTWRNDPELISCLGAPFRYINQDVDYAWYESYMKSRNTSVRCAILSDEDKFIGLVSLINIDHLNQSGEFHIMIGDPENKGKGAGTFATREILSHAFLNLNLQRVELTVLDSNMKAIALYEKIGFIREGTKRMAKYKNGRFVDMHIYSILRSEYIGM